MLAQIIDDPRAKADDQVRIRRDTGGDFGNCLLIWYHHSPVFIQYKWACFRLNQRIHFFPVLRPKAVICYEKDVMIAFAKPLESGDCSLSDPNSFDRAIMLFSAGAVMPALQ